MKKVTKEVMKVIAKASLASTTASANSACTWYVHQPKFPEKAKALRK
jgi:cyclic lactone autoinducer peptide